MKLEPQEPIRPRKRERVGVSGSLPANSQPTPRVLIRVPFVEAQSASTQSASILPSNSPKTTEHRPGSASDSTATTSFRIDSAHHSAPGPHLKPPAWIQQPGGWLAGVLQRKTLLAIGLVVSGLIAAIVFQQKTTHDSVTENVRPRRLAKGERHAVVQRKSTVESMSSTATQWTSSNKSTTLESAKLRANGSQLNVAGESPNSGSALIKSDVSHPVAASNVPAKVDSNSIPGSNDSLAPRMTDVQPPQSVAVLNSDPQGAPRTQFYILDSPPVYEARRDPVVAAPITVPATGTTNRAMFDGGPGKLPPK